MENSDLRTLWEVRLKEFACSRNSLAAWCREQGLPVHQAKYWQRKLRGNEPAGGQSPQWLTLEINEPGGTDINRQAAALCVKVGPALIEIQPGYNAELLKDVTRTLGTIC